VLQETEVGVSEISEDSVSQTKLSEAGGSALDITTTEQDEQLDYDEEMPGE